MPEITAKVKADTSDFDRKLKEATRKAREFADGVKEGGGRAINGLTGGTGGNLLGFAGAGAAGAAVVEGFKQIGEMLTDAVKEGINVFKEHEQSALHLGYKAGNPNLGEEIQEQMHAISGAGGNEAELSQAYGNLLDAGMEHNEDTLEKFQRLDLIAIGSGESIGSMTQGFRRAELGGLDVGEAASKLARTNPYIERMVRDEMKTHTASLAANRQGMYAAGRGEEFEAEMSKWNNMTVTDYLKGGNLTSDKFWEMVKKSTSEGGPYYDAYLRQLNTVSGKEAEKKKAEEENAKKRGQESSSGYKNLQQSLTDIEKNKAGFDQAFGVVAGAGMEYFSRGLNSAFNLSGPKIGDKGYGSFAEIQKAVDTSNAILANSAQLLGRILGVFTQ